MLPLTFAQADDRRRLDKATRLRITKVHNILRDGSGERNVHLDDDDAIRARHDLSLRQAGILLAGGAIAWKRPRGKP